MVKVVTWDEGATYLGISIISIRLSTQKFIVKKAS